MYAILHIPSGTLLLYTRDEYPTALFYHQADAHTAIDIFINQWRSSPMVSEEQKRTCLHSIGSYSDVNWADIALSDMKLHTVDEYTVVEVPDA